VYLTKELKSSTLLANGLSSWQIFANSEAGESPDETGRIPITFVGNINTLDKYSNTGNMSFMSNPEVDPLGHTLAELCVLSDMPVRTVRYYIQVGLVDRPEGETRAARYGSRHLEQLLLIRKWTNAGVSLERIGELLKGDEAPVPTRVRAAGSLEVRSHLTLADGIELVIEPGRAGLTPEQVRSLVKGVMAVFQKINH